MNQQTFTLDQVAAMLVHVGIGSNGGNQVQDLCDNLSSFAQDCAHDAFAGAVSTEDSASLLASAAEHVALAAALRKAYSEL